MTRTPHNQERNPRRLRPRRRPLRASLVLALLAALLAAPARSQTVPESSQLPIFFKLLTYDRTLWEQPRTSLRIGLLHHHDDRASHANLTAMVSALSEAAGKTINDARFDFTTLTWSSPEELPRLIATAEIDVLYVTLGHATYLEEIQGATRTHGILTLAADDRYVAAGLAVGIALENERPRVRVNLRALEAEGHRLDARVLRLCEVLDR